MRKEIIIFLLLVMEMSSMLHAGVIKIKGISIYSRIN